MGMIASDMAANFEDEFQLLEQKVIENMKIRDKALKEIRSYVQTLFVETKLLTRSDVSIYLLYIFLTIYYPHLM